MKKNDFKLIKGDIINTGTEIGRIVDVFFSRESDDFIVLIDFIRNATRSYDAIYCVGAKKKIFRPDEWRLATEEEIKDAVRVHLRSVCEVLEGRFGVKPETSETPETKREKE